MYNSISSHRCFRLDRQFFLCFFFIIVFFSFSLCSCPVYACQRNGDVKRIKIDPRIPLFAQFTKDSAIYIIHNVVDLKGGTVNIPDNSTLQIKKGLIKNGKLRGDFTIEAPARRVFEKVDLSEYDKPFKFVWIVGNRRDLYSEDFQNIPSTQIDFEGYNYTAKETIVLNELAGFHFINFNLSTDYSIRYWTSLITSGTCSPKGSPNDFINCIITQRPVPENYVGYIIEVTTADETKFDSRPDEKGLPTLYKGITSKIVKLDGDLLTIADSIEYFSNTKFYNKQRVQSRYVIYKPRKFVLSNCHFIFANKSGMSLNGSEYLIEDCSFEAKEGSNCILSLGGYSGHVNRCKICGASYPGTGTSYGIQVNKGSNIVIENSSFYENRRGVDFSGDFESRYNEVRNCSFYQEKNEGKTGSAIGGHSTSFGNVFRNNKICGDYQIGIHCRGENEVIIDNYFECMAVWLIGYGFNTVINNNIVKEASNFATGVFAGSDIDVKGNKLTVTNNEIDVRAVLIYGNSDINYHVNNNIVHYKPDTPSIKPIIFSSKPKNYEMNENSVNCERKGVKVKLMDGVDL